jgi:integrase
MQNRRQAAVIGAQLIKSLQPREKPYEVRDSRLTGFLIRVQPSGYMSYVAEWGRGKRKSIGRVGILTPAQARDLAREKLADAAMGNDPRELSRRVNVYTLEKYLSDRYGPWVAIERKTGKDILARLKSCFSEDLGKRTLPEINKWVVEKWRSKRLKSGITWATVNRDIGALKSALQKAVEWGLLESNPLSELTPRNVDRRPKPRFLSQDECDRLRKALETRENKLIAERERNNRRRLRRGRDPLPPVRDNLKPIVLVALNTGLRRGELFDLKWSDVNLGQAMLTVHGYQAKSEHTRHIPLNSEALGVLEEWKNNRSDSPYVFPNKDGERLSHIRRSWGGLVEQAKLKNFRFHDLRHDFASQLVMADVALNTVRELLGHADLETTLRYAHLAPEHTAAAVAKLVQAKK